jgi:hypothetical protein
MKIAREPPEEFHERMAVRYDDAAKAYASQISTTKDPVLRERLAAKARQQKQQAEYSRQKAAELRVAKDS